MQTIIVYAVSYVYISQIRFKSARTVKLYLIMDTL